MADNVKRANGPEDPERCQGMGAQGQCMNKKYSTSQYCYYHIGHVQDKIDVRERQNMYKLAKWQNRQEELKSHESIKSLRDEIGILRMTLESIIQQCPDTNDIIMQSSNISDLVTKITHTVTASHKLEKAMGEMLEKDQLVSFAQDIINIISKHSDPAIVRIIATEIESAIKKLGEINEDQ